jgi:hypothetical protein
MSFLIYFVVLLVSAGSVLFGLDLINSPLHSPPNVPIGRTVRNVEPTPAVREASAKAETKPAAKQQSTAKAADSEHKSATEQARKEPQDQQARAESGDLSPVYPASPGPAAPVITTGKASADGPQAVASKKDGDTSDKQDAATEKAQADAQQASAQQAKTQNACNEQACGAAYRSFRASDCTYQPFEGERRLCTKQGGADVATSARVSPRESAYTPRAQPPRRAARRDELDEVTRIVRGMPGRGVGRRQFRRDDELSEAASIVRRMTRGRSMGDVPVQLEDGSIVIVHTGDE